MSNPETMPGRCATCRWWSTDVAEQERGHCGLAHSVEGRAEHQQSLAVAQDGESYSAWLVTGPDFGCVQWGAATRAGWERDDAPGAKPGASKTGR